MTTAQFQQILLAQGYNARIDDDGDIVFEARNGPVYATVLEQDPAFVTFSSISRSMPTRGPKLSCSRGAISSSTS